MNLKNILLIVATCTIVLGLTYLTVIIYYDHDNQELKTSTNQ